MILLLLLPILAPAIPCLCPLSSVPSTQLSNAVCDPLCASSPCQFDNSACLPLCASSGCDLLLLSNSFCDQSCSSHECGWDGGDCGLCAENCILHSGFEGQLADHHCDTLCDVEACSWDGGDCLTVYVTEGRATSSLGTADSPFWTLSEAILAVENLGGKIAVLQGTHALTWALTSLIMRPLTDQTGFSSSDISLHIFGLLCTNSVHPDCALTLPVIAYDNLARGKWVVSGRLTLTNVMIVGNSPLVLGCAGLYCDYCPHVVPGAAGGVTDKGEALVEGSFVEQGVCDEFLGENFVEVVGEVWVENVRVEGFRQQFQSWLYVHEKASVRISNVTFSNIVVATSVILQSAISQFPVSGLISLSSVHVRLLGNGYAYRPDLRFGGLLRTAGLATVALTRVVAELNLLGVGGSLVYVENAVQMTISDCEFTTNVGVVLKVVSDIDFPTVFLADSAVEVYSWTHVGVVGCKFVNNTANSVLAMRINGDKLNISVKNCVFQSNFAFIDSILSLEVAKAWTTAEKFGQFLPFVLSNSLTSVYIPPNFIDISDVVMVNNAAARGLSVTNVSNCRIFAVNFTANGDKNVEKSISQFASDANSYISTNFVIIADNSPCVGTLFINSSINTSLNDAIFDSNYCENGPSTIFATKTEYNFTAFNLKITKNEGGSTSIFSILASDPVYLQNFTASNNILSSPQSSGIFLLTSASPTATFFISASVFEGNTASEGGTIRAYGWVSVSNSTFRGNSCSGDTPAGLSFSPSQYYSQVSLFRAVFVGQRAKIGAAMALLDRLSTRTLVALVISDSLFQDNVSEGSGSCLLLDSSVGITVDSVVKGTNFVGNSASNACVWTGFYRGVLRIEGGLFQSNRGTSTSVIYGQHPKSTATVASRIDIKDTIIELNTGFSTLFLINPDVYSEGTSTNVTVRSNLGRGFYLQYVFWTDTNSTFFNNSSPTSGAAFVILFYSQVSITSTKFLSNKGVLTGGSITTGILSKVNITNSRFESNAAERGGAIFGEQGAVVKLVACVFRKNVSNMEGSALYFLAGPLTSVNSTVAGTEFQENVSKVGQGTVALISSYMVFEGCVFRRNEAKTASGVLVILSVLTVIGSKFADQISPEGVFISSAAGSSVNISSCEFSNGTASEKAGAVFFSATTVYISNSLFRQLTAKHGTALAAYSESTLRIVNSTFTNQTALESYGGVIYINESPLTDRGNTYSSCSNGIIIGEIADIDVKGSLFESNSYTEATSVSGAGIYCRDCGTVSIRTSSFQNLSAEYGSCLHLFSSKTPGLLNVSKSTFSSSKSVQQGAIVLENENAVIADCQFTDNSAIGGVDEGDGGALFLACGGSAGGCFTRIGNSSFQRNLASHNGGAIYWTDWEPELEKVDFEGNEAPYGADVASFAIALQLTTPGEISEVPSSQPFIGALRARLIDHYGQQVKTDNSSLGDLLPVWTANTSVSGSSRVQAKLGEFIFEEFSVTSTPGKLTYLKVVTAGIDQAKDRNNPAHTFISVLPFAVSMRPCVPGETIVGEACYVCPEGKYSLDPAESCANCPSGAVCLGNCTMTPKEGYWRARNDTDVFLECPYKQACLGTPAGAKLSPTGACATGYYGNLCHGCLSGYSRTGANQCARCPDTWVNGIQITGVVVAFALVVMFIIKMSLVSAHKQQSHSSIFLKIFVNYLQLTAAASSFNLNWPQVAIQSFKLKENAANVSTQLFSFDCFVNEGGNDNQADTVFLKTLVVAGIPVLIIGISGVFWGIMSAATRNKGYLKHQMVNSIVVMFFVAHPSIITFMFDMFNCREIEKGQYWLNSFLNIRCWDRLHSRYALLVALPALMLWGVFTPLLALLTLISLRRRLFFLEMKIRLGFLYNGYVVSKYYWEFVIMYRKMVIIAMAVFLTTVSSTFQALGVLLVLMVSLVVHVYSSPYNASVFNQLEKRSILVSAVTLYCGLFYMTEQLGYVSQLALFVAILLVNLYFLLMWAMQLCKAGCLILLAHFPFMSRLWSTANYIIAAKAPRIAPSDELSVDLSSHLSFDQSVDKRRSIEVPANSVLDGSSIDLPQATPTLIGRPTI